MKVEAEHNAIVEWVANNPGGKLKDSHFKPRAIYSLITEGRLVWAKFYGATDSDARLYVSHAALMEHEGLTAMLVYGDTIRAFDSVDEAMLEKMSLSMGAKLYTRE